MDQAAPAALFRRPFLIQVQPGGPLSPLPPVNLPGIIVFSQELQEALLSVHSIPPQHVVLSRGRVDFAQSLSDARPFLQSVPTDNDRVRRILTSSRLPDSKAPAIEALFEQAAIVAQQQPLDVFIIGDGEAKPRLEQYARRIMSEAAYPLSIKFLGAWRVSAKDVLQADIVVGQGRSVIEAVAWGVPTAVCGADGYFGLLTCDSLPALARTNLTGREIAWRADLLTDLRALSTYAEQEFPAVRSACASMYGVHCAVDGIEAALTQIIAENGGASVSRPKLARAYCGQALTYLAHRVRRWWAAVKPNHATYV